MSFLDQLIGTIAPHACLNCQAEGKLLCQQCVQKLQFIPSRCYRCHKLTDESRTCNTCRKMSRLFRLQVGTIYEGLAKSLVWQLKYAGAQAAAKEIADFLAIRTKVIDSCLIVPVPTASSRVRRRGYDQAKLIGRKLAKKHGLPYLDCLARSGQTHQIGSRREKRLKQLSSAYRIKVGQTIQNTHIILIDDVVTTGASLEAAARYLRNAGAEQVEAIVFAQA